MSKTILLTGSTGFLGTFIKYELEKHGFKTITLGRKNCDIKNDLSKNIPELPKNIDFIIHAAGKAHFLPKTEKEKALFYEINYNGTLNLLEGIKQSSSDLKGIVFISSVSVYGLIEGVEITETDSLSATDPYGKSKILAEEAISIFCNSGNIKCTILRLPLIAGKNPPGNLGKMIKAIKKGTYLSIGKAEAKKSMVLVEDIASFIPSILDNSGIFNLTDGYHPSFKELETSIAVYLTKRKPFKIPQSLANIMAKTGNILGSKAPFNSNTLRKIQSTLTFSDKKARIELGWNPLRVIDNIDKIV